VTGIYNPIKVRDQAMYAIIKTGGKNYKVAKDDVIEIEKLENSPGETVEFDEVLFVGGEGKNHVGTPKVEGAKVTGEIVGHKRDKKVIIFKKRKRQNYRRKHGHRQEVTEVKVTGINK
jgi:large subunit ribosomal protein L21